MDILVLKPQSAEGYNNMTETASIYARESSDDTNKAPSIKEQIARSMQYAEQEGYEVVEVYEDNGYSGGDWKRPSFIRLKDDAKRHLFKVVIVWSQDRIARDVEQFLNFYRTLKESYVKVYSITEGLIDLETLGGLAQNVSLAMASHIFRKVTSDKVRKAYTSKRNKAEKEGVKVEWGRKPMEIDVNSIIAFRKQGLGYRQISWKIGGISYQTIRRVLQKYLPENKEIAKSKIMKRREVTQ